jgi:hypothetical protein
MSRNLIFAGLCVAAICLAESTTNAPTVTISVYAPVQKGSPLRIVALHYADDGIGVTLQNDSEKTVVGFSLGDALGAATECSAPQDFGSTRKRMSLLGGKGENLLRILPHATATLLEDSPVDPVAVVFAAKDLRTAYLQVQLVLGGVRFEDNTTWVYHEPAITEANPQALPEPGLLSRDKSACSKTDASAVWDALEKVTKVGFNDRVRPISDPVAKLGSVTSPKLVFDCLLDGELAMCPHVVK